MYNFCEWTFHYASNEQVKKYSKQRENLITILLLTDVVFEINGLGSEWKQR